MRLKDKGRQGGLRVIYYILGRYTFPLQIPPLGPALPFSAQLIVQIPFLLGVETACFPSLVRQLCPEQPLPNGFNKLPVGLQFS